MVRRRLVRDDAPLPDEAVLVRSLFDVHPDGQTFDRDQLVADATRNFELFGYYGLSLWAVAEEWSLDRILEDKARRAARVALFAVGDLKDWGLDVMLSGNVPHVDVTVRRVERSPLRSVQVTAHTADDLADRFLSAAYTVVENFYFVATQIERGPLR